MDGRKLRALGLAAAVALVGAGFATGVVVDRHVLVDDRRPPPFRTAAQVERAVERMTADLLLDDGQADAVKRLLLDAVARAYPDEDARQERAREILKETDALIEKVLTEPQRERFKEIRRRGPPGPPGHGRPPFRPSDGPPPFGPSDGPPPFPPADGPPPFGPSDGPPPPGRPPDRPPG